MNITTSPSSFHFLTFSNKENVFSFLTRGRWASTADNLEIEFPTTLDRITPLVSIRYRVACVSIRGFPLVTEIKANLTSSEMGYRTDLIKFFAHVMIWYWNTNLICRVSVFVTFPVSSKSFFDRYSIKQYTYRAQRHRGKDEYFLRSCIRRRWQCTVLDRERWANSDHQVNRPHSFGDWIAIVLDTLDWPNHNSIFRLKIFDNKTFFHTLLCRSVTV